VGAAIDPQVIKGPSIGDIAAQTSQEGIPRPIIYGTSPPITGNIIAALPPRVVKRRQSAGKGSGPKVETESVYRTYAIRISEGPVGQLIRAWRNGILVFDSREGSEVESGTFLSTNSYYNGSYEQNPDP